MFKKGWETPWEFLHKPACADGPLPALRVNPRATGSRTRFLALPPPAASLHKNHLESGHKDRPVQKPYRGTARQAGVWRLGRERVKSQALRYQQNTVTRWNVPRSSRADLWAQTKGKVRCGLLGSPQLSAD